MFIMNCAMRITLLLAGILLSSPGTTINVAADAPALKPLAIDDLFLIESAQQASASDDANRVAFIRRWIDSERREERFSLWTLAGDASAGKSPEPKPLESGEPDARSPVFSPDGKWIAIRSTRSRPEGWRQTPLVPLQSDAATDIWLVATDGSRVLPLAGPDKPYGRVFNDPFYGRVAFSRDGTRLAFIADDGRDPQSAEEKEAGVQVVRPDQGEGYTSYGTAQVWVAELDPEPRDHAARRIRRLTNDSVWYGDPQWSPNGRVLVAHANKTSDVESVRFSINKNYDLWEIDVATAAQRRLTSGPGPEVSPRISPDGTRVVCLSSPRRGPHADIFNMLVVPLQGNPEPRTVFDHHGTSTATPPHPVPSFPLPDDCWNGERTVVYTSFRGTAADTIRLDVESGAGVRFNPQEEAGEQTLVRKRMLARGRAALKNRSVLKDRAAASEQVVEWTNDGHPLEGVLTIPPVGVGRAPYPLIVFPHGGPHSRSTTGFNLTAHIFAASGYLVFQPNFRGSAGYGRAFLDADREDFGGGDMRDILTGIDHLVSKKLADPKRQFVYGVSYGGFMTCWLVGHTTQFRAAVCQNAVTDLNVMWGLTDIQSWTEWEFKGRPWEVSEAMRRHSPAAYADKIATPTLILHARDDRRCPIAMGRLFHQSLVSRNVPTGMIIYPDEGHGIKQPRHMADVLRRTLAWFRQHDVRPVEIVTLGDSITRGERPGVKPDETFSALLERQLQGRGIAATVTNLGLGGEQTVQALARLERDVLARKPQFVTIMYGTNDSYIYPGKDKSRLTVDEYRENLKQLVTRLRAASIEPILMTEPRWGAAAKAGGTGLHPNVPLEPFMQACREVARQTETPLVDHFAHWSEQEAGGWNVGAWTTDECHPNPDGHRVLAETMLPVLLKALGDPARTTEQPKAKGAENGAQSRSAP